MISKRWVGILGLMICLGSSLKADDVALMRVPHGGIQPQAQVDSSGVLHLVYYLGEPGNGDLYYVTRFPGETDWSTPIRVNHYPHAAVSGGTIRGAQMCIGKGNRIHVAWFGSGEVAKHFSDEEKPSTPLLVTRLADDGRSFEKERNLMTWTSVLDGGGAITCDASGRVWVAWHARGASEVEGEMGRDMFLAVSHDEGKTFSREHHIKEAPRGACACCGMRVRYVAPDRLHIAYRGIQGKARPMIDLWSNNGGESFQYTHFNPWEIEACPMSSVSLLDVSKSGLLIANEQSGQIRLNLKRDLNGLVTPLSPEQGEMPGKHPSMAMDPHGRILLTWAVGAGWAKGGNLSWKLLDSSGKNLSVINNTDRHDIPVWSFPTAVYFNQQLLVLY